MKLEIYIEKIHNTLQQFFKKHSIFSGKYKKLIRNELFRITEY